MPAPKRDGISGQLTDQVHVNGMNTTTANKGLAALPGKHRFITGSLLLRCLSALLGRLACPDGKPYVKCYVYVVCRKSQTTSLSPFNSSMGKEEEKKKQGPLRIQPFARKSYFSFPPLFEGSCNDVECSESIQTRDDALDMSSRV